MKGVMMVLAMVAAAALATGGGAFAQEKKASKEAPKVAMKAITENDKVKVYEATYAPGAENTAVATTSTRVVRALTNGQLLRSYADGKKETIHWKAGKVEVIPPGPAYTTKNTGKTTLHLYVVQLK